VGSRAIAEVRADEGEGALLVPVRRREEQRRVEVPAVLARALEHERRDPVVVLARRLAVRERAEDEQVRLLVAHAPGEREEHVGVDLRRAALVVHEPEERLAVLLRRLARARRGGRGEAARVLEVERREQPEAVVALPLLVIRKELALRLAGGRQ